MGRYFVIEPEVAGGLGADTVMDSSVHPPRVSELHYEFEGWFGDDLLESFPCFIVTDRCRVALERARLSGCAFSTAKVTVSDTFHELYPGRSLPVFYWLKVSGVPGKDDFGISSDQRLTVSERVLRVLESFSIEHCDVEDFANSAGSDDSDDSR
jgi:hypothetical protein